MGAFRYMQGTMTDLLDIHIRDICRDQSATPAVGSSRIHAQEQEQILTAAIGPSTTKDTTSAPPKGRSGRAAKSA